MTDGPRSTASPDIVPEGDGIAAGVGAEAAARPPRRRFAAEAMIVAFSRVLTRFGTFATGILIARFLGADGRGTIAALSVPAQLAGNLAELGVRQSTAYHIGRGVFPVPRIVAALVGLWPMMAIVSIALALGYFQITGTAAGDWPARLLAVATIPSVIGTAYVTGVLLGRGSIVAFSRASWLPAAMTLTVTGASLAVFGFDVHGALIGSAVGSLAGFLYGIHVLRREAPIAVAIDWEVVRKIQRLGLNFAVATFALMLNYKIMVLILSRVSTLEQVGLYAQAASIAEMLWEVPQMVSSLLFSRAVNAQDRDAMSQKILMFARVALVFVACVAIGTAIVAPYLFPFLYGAEFAPSARICVLLLPGVVAFVLFRIIQTDVHSRGKAWITTCVLIPALALNIGLGYTLINAYGATGAAVASSLTYCAVTLAYLVIYSRLTRIPLTRMFRYRRSDADLLIGVIVSKLPSRFRRKRG